MQLVRKDYFRFFFLFASVATNFYALKVPTSYK